MLVLIKKSEKEVTPVDATEAQLAQLISVWGRPNVVDAATGEPFPEPVSVATLSVVDDPANFNTAPDTGVVNLKPAQTEQATIAEPTDTSGPANAGETNEM